VIVYLAGKSISAVKFDGAQSARFGGYSSGEIKVGTLLNLFSPSFGESIENRKRFGKNGPLVKNGFIIIHSPRSYSFPPFKHAHRIPCPYFDEPESRSYSHDGCRYSTELVDCVVTMDRRKLDKLVGLKTDIDEILEGSHLYAEVIFLQLQIVTFLHVRAADEDRASYSASGAER
jgi:hypothetical protein